jgi:hypothetical protein
MMRMQDVVELCREKGCTSKVIIGGACITQSFADDRSRRLLRGCGRVRETGRETDQSIEIPSSSSVRAQISSMMPPI